MIFFWAFFFGIIANFVASHYGIPYLFLAPEYNNRVDAWSYCIMGVVFGFFIMTFNISSYATNASRFPFIATLSRPFLKYSINNLILPGAFMVVYGWRILEFYKNIDGKIRPDVYFYIGSLYAGTLFCLLITYLYFFSTNKNIFTFFGIKKPGPGEPSHPNPKELPKIKRKWWEFLAPLQIAREWRVETYLNNFFQIRLARSYAHYDQDIIVRVFNQNHNNATRFLLVILCIFFGLSFFREYFNIPAGASIVLLITILLTVITILFSWFRGWAFTLSLIVILGFNFFTKFETFRFRNRVSGLNYDTVRTQYTYSNLKKFVRNKEILEGDFHNTLEILNNWKSKNPEKRNPRNKKIRLAIINTSGGGLRSTVWTTRILQYADSILGGKLLSRTAMMTGSSGGMIGAAYIRELYLQEQLGTIKDYYHDTIIENISKDLLNPLSFSLALHDLFFRVQTYSDGRYVYSKDRGYAFEKQLNLNTHYILDKRLSDYSEPEKNGIIPMMVLSPTIVNDGRRLIISSQPVSYIAQNLPLPNVTNTPLIECIEFTRFMKDQDAMNLKLLSALRMNATFPFIMPVISLPSEPTVEVLDAGNRDNFGLLTTIKFIHSFRQWLNSNTNGLIVIQIRDSHKDFEPEEKKNTLLEYWLNPLEQFYTNTFKIQDYTHDQLFEYAATWYKGEIQVIDFQLRNEGEDKISLSWHLTEKEKQQVLRSVYLPENIQAIEKLRALLD